MSFFRDPVVFLTQWLNGVLAGWGLPPAWVQVISFTIGGAILATGAMLFVTILIWGERKLLGRVQDRYGPNRLGPWGIFQSFADMLKIFIKEHITPVGVDLIPYNLAPILSVAAVLMVWSVIPLSMTMYGVDLSVGLLYFVAVGALGELGIIMAGWGSNNKYALLGAFRAVAQLISYEVPMVVSLLVPVMLAGSLSMNEIVKQQNIWVIFISPLAALIFFVTQIAEVGRAPFDLVEAESELVAGFNIEYSGLKFGMFFVAEFVHAFTVALIFTTLFLGGWRGPGAEQYPLLGFIYLMLKTTIVYFIAILMRGSLPRFRIDQMMDVNWKLLTPLSLILIAVTALAVKAMQPLSPWISVPVNIVLNLILIYLTQQLLVRYFKRRKIREVGSRNRPVARLEEPVTSTAESEGSL